MGWVRTSIDIPTVAITSAATAGIEVTDMNHNRTAEDQTAQPVKIIHTYIYMGSPNSGTGRRKR